MAAVKTNVNLKWLATSLRDAWSRTYARTFHLLTVRGALTFHLNRVRCYLLLISNEVRDQKKITALWRGRRHGLRN